MSIGAWKTDEAEMRKDEVVRDEDEAMGKALREQDEVMGKVLRAMGQVLRDEDDDKVTRDEDPLLEALKLFYSHPRRLQDLTDCLRGPTRVSLRVLDWLVTNYAKRVNIVYPTTPHSAFNIHNSYKSQLRGYRKARFDPFCRRERLTWTDPQGRRFETTTGQLNFFRWAMTTGVVSYCRLHAKTIEADMLAAQAKRQEEQKRSNGDKVRRKELSQAAARGCTSTNIDITVTFA